MTSVSAPGGSATGPVGEVRTEKLDNALPDPRDRGAFEAWLKTKPREWSMVIAARAALRVLPLVRQGKYRAREASVILLPVFRAVAIARFAAAYPNRAIPTDDAATTAAARAAATADAIAAKTVTADAAARATTAARAAAAAAAFAAYAARVATAATAAATARTVTGEADAAARAATAYAHYVTEIGRDALALNSGAPPDRVARAQLWQAGERRHVFSLSRIGDAWEGLRNDLFGLGEHWQVWIDWYDEVLAGSPPSPARSEAWEAAFTDVQHPSYPWKDPLPWDDGPEAVNLAIKSRLDAVQAAESRKEPRDDLIPIDNGFTTDEAGADPQPLDGIPSSVAIVQRPDGRISAEAGAFSLPDLPPSLTREDLARTLAACRKQAERLLSTASAPTFNGRPDYADALAAYLEWLPTAPGTGNILLADGEARVLNKLFTADEGILATGFASRLSVFLEDHIGLRAHFEVVERHYQAVRTGRLETPLERDAVEGIKQAVHDNTPAVFDESVRPVVDETAKPVPEPAPLAPEDRPPPDPNRPKPPRDPIADVDPRKSRSFIFAAAANRIWQILLQGKDVPTAIDGWRRTYEQMKPHMGPILDWLRVFAGG